MYKILSIAVCLFLLTSTTYASNYRQSVYNNRQRVVVQEKVIQFGSNLKVIGIPVTDLYPEYYYKTSEKQQGAMINEDALAKKIADELAKRLIEMGIRPVEPIKPPSEKIVEDAVALIDKRCASCHTGDKPDGGLAFLDLNSKLNLRDVNEKLTDIEIAWDMFSAVLEEKMPKSGNKLAPNEVEILHKLAKYLTKTQREKSE